MTQNLILIGFASTGKSTTGREVAAQLGWTFIDIDDVVEEIHVKERGEKRRCREIFSLYGRDCFVNYEAKALDTLSSKTHAVIATGGGTPMSEQNRERIAQLGHVVYLNATVSVIFERMAEKGYPQYLGNNPTIADLEILWRERNAVYQDLADWVIDNTALSPTATADAIAAHLKEQQLLGQ